MSEPRKPVPIRCAIYTRKSSEEGLEQDFNSLAAQREACEAYIRSQAHEGWMQLPDHFDDGGFSGGTIERPALRGLLDLVTQKKVDVIVIYKIDRLTRSLMDFARLATLFEKSGVSFVSVTQSFNTTDSMGRLMLNVLLSFAQFERELTGERIRDKFAASKRRGMWMGGPIPLGYDVRQRSLVINDAEASTVRLIFELYLELRTVSALEEELKRRGVVTKRAVNRKGIATGGLSFARGHLYKLLGNPLYIGQIRHRTELHKGLHEAIIDRTTWKAVQAQLEGNAQGNRTRPNARSPSLLAGLLVDEFGNRLTASHAVKDGKRYRYYISRPSTARGSHNQPVSNHRLPAAEVEAAVLGTITEFLRDPVRLVDELELSSLDPDVQSAVLAKAGELVAHLNGAHPTEQRETCLDLIESAMVVNGRVETRLLRAALHRRLGIDRTADMHADALTLTSLPLELRPSAAHAMMGGITSSTVPALIRAIACGRAWFEELSSGRTDSPTAIAQRVGVSPEYVRRILDLAFLAPSVVGDVVSGTSPDITVKNLTVLDTVPVLWSDQHRWLGQQKFRQAPRTSPQK